MIQEREERVLYVNNNSITDQVTDDLKKFAAEKVKARKGEEASNQIQQQLKPEQLCFPFWPETVRAVPNSILRSALFGICKIRVTCKRRTLIGSNSDCEIRFKGERFNQTDLDVFEGLLHMAMRKPLGHSVEFSLAEFLCSLGRIVGSSQKEKLREELARLMSGMVEIKWIKEQKTFMGTLIQKTWIDEATNRYVVVFDKDLIKLFDRGHSYIDHQQRLRLGQHSLAKWLHGFYSSHARPYPYKVVTIQKLSGSTSQIKEFRRLLVSAFEKLIDVGLVQSWKIESTTDLLQVNIIPTNTQKRHIARMVKK